MESIVIAALIGLLIGHIEGYRAHRVTETLSKLYAYWKDRIETPAGVVRPERTLATRNQPIDLSSEAGGVRRPTPDEVLAARIKADREALR
jgi:hypothetical protein